MGNKFRNPADLDGWSVELTTGELYERSLGNALRFAYGRTRGFKSTVGTALDTHGGTDFIIDGVRVDVTARPVECKSGEVHVLPESMNLEGGFAYIDYGLRRSNGHKGAGDFDQPVLVIGIRAGYCGSLHNRRVWNRLDDIVAERIRDIVELGMSQFWDGCDRLGLEF